MKIVGFGDSFITPASGEYYTNIIADHFQADAEFLGYQGSGTWDAFFTFMEYVKHNSLPDVVMFVWSNTSRLYHHRIRDICPTGVIKHKDSGHIVWQAAELYYAHLYDDVKAEYEFRAFYYWLDHWLAKTYPTVKFIHMWSFPHWHGEKYALTENDKFQYYHRFTNGIEIRPALIYLSTLDGWPSDGLANETRTHHLTNKMHKFLANKIIDALTNYKNGQLYNIC